MRQSAFDCTAFHTLFPPPRYNWQQWIDIDSLEVYNWSPSLCQQVEIVAEQAINQKTELMKGEIKETQTNNTCISELPGFCWYGFIVCTPPPPPPHSLCDNI